MHRTRRTRRSAVATLLLVAAPGCGWLSDGPDGPPVVIVGDSITGLIADDYADSDAPFDLTLRATNGYTTAEMLPQAREVADRAYEQAIINLGTNDAMKAEPIEETTAALAEMLALFDETSCIHLTTLNEGAVGFGDGTLGQRMSAVNEHLRALADEHDRIDLIDWNAALVEHEQSSDEPLLDDSVHPNEAGQRLLTELSVAALDSCVADLP